MAGQPCRQSGVGMSRDEARAALIAAGADDVAFMDSFGFTTGIKVEAGGKANAVRWADERDGTRSAVVILKDWLAHHARAR